MKYFTSELWRSINASDPQARDLAFARSDEAFRLYHDYLESIRQRISARRWNAVMQCHALHDRVIRSIAVTHRTRGRRSVVDVRIDLDEKTVLFRDVTRFSFQIDNQTAFPCGSYSWGCCEFELLDAGRMSVSILGDVSNQMELEFGNIECRRNRKN